MDNVREKLDRMLEILKSEYEAEYKSIEAEYENKLEEAKKNFEKDIEDYRKEKFAEAKIKIDEMIRVAKSKAKLLLNQEKLRLKNQLFEKIMMELRKRLLNLPVDKKKYFYRKLYMDAVKIMSEDYTVVCNPEDKDIVMEIVSSKPIETDENVEGGMILKGKRVSVVSTVDSFLEENKSKIFSLILKEVGELR